MAQAKIKICGMTRQADVLFAASLGAWAVGFIFHRKSPRYIDPHIVGTLGSSKALKIGVFVNSSHEEILATVKTARLSGVQLHGDESPELCSQLKGGLEGKVLIKAFRLKSEAELAQVSRFGMCDARLVDAYVEGLPGGTGKIARWDLATLAKASGPLILSGGLSTDNIAQALGQVSPDGFDVSSGVEDSPGIKNHAKIRAFMQTVRIYESQS
jgi:phosphoribosylanthranilate isomerase